MILRERQRILVDKCIKALGERNATIAVAPTGFGKTVVISAIIGELIDQNSNLKVCVIAHRDELTYQNEHKFKLVNPEITTSLVNGVVKDWSKQVICAMVQTLSRENNLAQMPLLDLLVIDEAHHITASSYQSIIERAKELNPNLKLLGVTATPSRGDKKGLGDTFKHCADIVHLTELITSGHLVMPRTHIINLNIHDQLKALKAKGNGDYDDDEVDAIMNTQPINEAVVMHWVEKARNRKTVVFCSTIRHAINITNSFNEYGINTALVTGEMSKEQRKEVLQSMTNGEIQVIVNVAVLTEGWDYPPISCVVLLRSSSYKSTMIQMIGRGLRIVDNREYPGIVKTDCIVLDFGISCLLHKTLETDINLELMKDSKDTQDSLLVTHKKCPDCYAEVPVQAQECIFCGLEFNKEVKEKVIIHDFKMREIDMLNKTLAKSHFAWEENKKDLFACGFNSWCVIRPKDGHFIVIGGALKDSLEIETAVLYEGDKLTAIAKGNDFLSENETISYAKKNAGWRQNKPSEKQLELLAKFKKFSKLDPENLTRGQVSNIFAYEFNAKKQIKQLGV